MQKFEQILANVCNRCVYAYGGMGAVGYNYASAKDNLKWHKLRAKEWLHIVLAVGNIMVLDDKEFAKSTRPKEQNTSDMAKMLLAAFGS